MKHVWLWSLIFLIGLVGCSFSTDGGKGGTDGKGNGKTSTNETGVEVLADGLDIPWSVVEAEESVLVSERGGAIVEVPKNGGDPARKKLELEHSVRHQGEGGFLGLTLAPDFKESRALFAYHTYRAEGQVFNRVVRLEEADEVWVETDVLIDAIPGAGIHNGGRIQIGPDDKLYITTGDAADEPIAQDLENPAGKILRVELDGGIPDDNPYPGSPVYSYGHRNPQGLAWDEDGQLYSSEHGPTGRDEINRIKAGNNYGWPEISGDEKREGMETPLYHSGSDTWAPSGLAYADGKLWVAGLRGEQVRSFSPDGKQTELKLEGEGRLRDIVPASDGSFYILTNNNDGRGTPHEKDDRLLRWTRPDGN
ncbi:PQQ-dependent sugar dehydrogenase [Desmospora profundinema]|uniref:Glucose/arabinose dehydrogenase n=1 Tax=Desmospora profundinema TaxID=1571184 RepID=A0ABU1IRB3_9BACL|nr:PQQ-dependent sugar dehydrogenase [Desmospora profundinema]MDR6227330.1 glucose/arabinose dehydrogenase [Desmospora profundinema]